MYKLLQRESIRLQSFDAVWKQRNNFTSIEALAKAGFYYFHAEDYVQCVFCHIQIGLWVPEDVPELEHKRLNPHCPFMNGLPVGNISATAEKLNPISNSDLSEDLQFKQLRRKIDRRLCALQTPEIRSTAIPERGFDVPPSKLRTILNDPQGRWKRCVLRNPALRRRISFRSKSV